MKCLAQIALTIGLALIALAYAPSVSLAEDPVPTCPFDPPNCGR